MPIVQFTKRQFEAALGNEPWHERRPSSEEYEYQINVTGDVAIIIRSSVSPYTGRSAAVGENSIRAWLADPDGKPLAHKLQKYITRVVGWEKRLQAVIETLTSIGLMLGECPDCDGTRKAFETKQGPNKGRWFINCTGCKFFAWLED